MIHLWLLTALSSAGDVEPPVETPVDDAQGGKGGYDLHRYRKRPRDAAKWVDDLAPLETADATPETALATVGNSESVPETAKPAQAVERVDVFGPLIAEALNAANAASAATESQLARRRDQVRSLVEQIERARAEALAQAMADARDDEEAAILLLLAA